MTKTALDEELTGHLGHDKHDLSETGNVGNGTRPKTVLIEATGKVEIDILRDCDGTFAPQIVKKRQRRLSGVDEIYGASVSKETISRITDRVIEEMGEWVNRPLEGALRSDLN